MFVGECSAEERLRHQYSQLSQKYVEQLISDEVIDTEGVLAVIDQLENMLSTLLSPLVDEALGLVKKVTRVFTKPRPNKEHYLIAFNALAASLNSINIAEIPKGTHQLSSHKTVLLWAFVETSVYLLS